MEKIIIKNFLIFDELEMPIKKFNILIGEQASGKSLLAKLVYFFNGALLVISKMLGQHDDVEFLEQIVLEDFCNIFMISKNNKSWIHI